MSQLRQQQQKMVELGIEVVVVTFEDEEQASNYLRETQLQWPMVVDRGRELYRHFGLDRAGFRDIWGIASCKAYLREMMKGRMPKPTSGDIHQRGGDILLDPQGIVRFRHIGKGPADRPDIEDIFAIVAAATDSAPDG